MKPLKYYKENPKVFLSSLLMVIGFWLPDKLYLMMLYYLNTGSPLNLRHPQTFGEKMQWLKLYDRKAEYTMMVDKYTVKEYVAGIIGKEYIIPTLGVWDRPEDVNFDNLPQQFVLKTTHGGGSTGVVICKDKFTLDKNRVIKELKKSLRQDIYQKYREWPYKNVQRRIIAEQYLEDVDNPDEDMIDYKFYCFNGKPQFCQVIGGRHTQETIDFYDMNWQHQEFIGLIGLNTKAVNSSFIQCRPRHFDKMKEIAHILSQGIAFSRIDLYDTIERPYFGEITLYPFSGLGEMRPFHYNLLLGEMIKLYKQ